MTKRISKREWERRKPTIRDLYRTHQLTEVIQIMGDKYGFHAEKRQYVYRLEQWNIRKYKVGQAEADSPSGCEGDGDDSDDDPPSGKSLVVGNNILAPPMPRLNNHLSPYSDGPSPSQRSEDHLCTMTPSGQDSQDWNEEQRQRMDLMLAVPNNTLAFERCLSLWRSFLSDTRAGPLGQAVLYACVRMDVVYRPDNLHEALNDMQRQARSPIDQLRLSLIRYFLHPDGISVSSLFTCIDSFLKDPKPDLGLFPLIARFVLQQVAQVDQSSNRRPSRLPHTFRHKDDLLNDFASKMAKRSGATHVLRSCVEWCQRIYASPTGRTTCIDMQSQPLTTDQRRQLGIAEVACSLTKRLLCEPQESRLPWVINSQSHLGISPVTCLATVTRMASNYCQRYLGHSFAARTPYEQMDYGAYELLFRADERNLWRKFIDALLEVDEISTMANLSQVLQDTTSGHFGQDGSSSTMEDHTFFNSLNMLVQSFVCDQLAPEIREVDSESQSLCPDLDITAAGSHQGSHSPATPAMLYPPSSHNPFPMNDATLQITQDVSLMGVGFYDQPYCDMGHPPLSSDDPAFYEAGLYHPG